MAKLTKEQKLERKRIQERERYQKIKANPQLYAIQKEKEKRKYENKKKTKSVKLVADMTPRERRMNRNIWRDKKRKLKNRKVTPLPETPSCSDSENIDLDSNIEALQPRVSSGKKRIKIDRRSKVIQRNKRLVAENQRLKRRCETLRKRLQRLNKVGGHRTTPKSQIHI